jgi:hypothetical protein
MNYSPQPPPPLHGSLTQSRRPPLPQALSTGFCASLRLPSQWAMVAAYSQNQPHLSATSCASRDIIGLPNLRSRLKAHRTARAGAIG